MASTGSPIDGLDRFASTSSSPLQFVNAQTQPHPPIARLLLGRGRTKRRRPRAVSPLANNAQATRAILLASATATTLNGLRSSSC